MLLKCNINSEHFHQPWLEESSRVSSKHLQSRHTYFRKNTRYVFCFKRKEFPSTLNPIKSWSTTRIHILTLGFVINCCRVISLSRVIKLCQHVVSTAFRSQLERNEFERIFSFSSLKWGHFLSLNVFSCNIIKHSLTAMIHFPMLHSIVIIKVFYRGSWRHGQVHTSSKHLSTPHTVRMKVAVSSWHTSKAI